MENPMSKFPEKNDDFGVASLQESSVSQGAVSILKGKSYTMNIFEQSENNNDDNKQIHSGKQASLSFYMDLAWYLPP